MSEPQPDKPEEKPRRRWFQYRLRTLFIVMTVLGVSLGIYADRARRQEAAILQVERLPGARVWYNYRYGYDEKTRNIGLIYENPRLPGPEFLHNWLGAHYFTGVYSINLNTNEGREVPVEVLEQLADSTRLKQLTLISVPLTDAHLKQIARISHLKFLNMAETGIGDRQLRHVAGLADLRSLSLERTPITNAGIAHLENLHRLEYVSLEETLVTDEGLEHLSKLSNLRSVELDGLPITDAGLKHLEGLKSLEILDLHETQVTEEGVKKLQQALPNAEIEYLGPKY